jgi:hypothetical protein
MSEQSKRFEDYLPGGAADPAPAQAPAGGLEGQIQSTDAQQQAREQNATPVDWEERYKNLEVLNSQQAQLVGEYKNVIDNFIANPTPATPEPVHESTPITSEDLYENPDETVRRAVDSHPAIQEAREIKAQFEAQQRQGQVNSFRTRHPDYESIAQTPEFAIWVQSNPTRMALAQSANGYDMNSADALFSLYKAEKGISQMTQEASEAQAIQAASLENSSSVMAPEPAQYSRYEYVQTLKRAKQGDLDAEEWIRANQAGYRLALESGNVRD